MSWYYLDEANAVRGPIGVEQLADYPGWSEAWRDRTSRERPHGLRPCTWERVAFAGIGDDCTISTIFMGLDHSLTGQGLPVVFETLISGGPLDQDMDRYCTWDQAVT